MTSRPNSSGRPVADAILQRRSIRRYLPGEVETEALFRITSAGLAAPAPHHSRPWRFAIITSEAVRTTLAESMAAEWREELVREGASTSRISDLTEKSVRRITEAPAIVVGCIDTAEIRARNDNDLDQQEWTMAHFSLGAAMQNLMLTAAEEGFGTCWIASPLYCPQVVREVLELPGTWLPQALLTIGIPDPEYVPPTREAADTGGFVLFR
ncbi:MAG: nitroreductase [Acidobacteria bacterium]|nr:MAG: nitroreductase [Acidobacteriota bacterium]